MSEGADTPYVIGLTGGIGSGKTAVADAFAALAVDVTDTDRLAHMLTAPGEAGYTAILDAFGAAMRRSDGSLDRDRLRALVFTDDSARATLETILHPLIGRAARREITGWKSPYGIVVVPLLFERGGLAATVDRTLVVDCPEQEQVRRTAARSGLAPEEIRAIMATQLARRDRLARADDVIDNSGPLAAIAPRVAELDRRYRAFAAERAECGPDTPAISRPS
jgi:dephospho-CoA kinase